MSEHVVWLLFNLWSGEPDLTAVFESEEDAKRYAERQAGRSLEWEEVKHTKCIARRARVSKHETWWIEPWKVRVVRICD